MLIDSHCHLDRLNYESLHRDPKQVIEQAVQQDVHYMLVVSISLDEYQNMRQSLNDYSNLFFSCGVHPLHVHESKIEVERLRRLGAQERVVALGETGLDYFYSPETREQQIESFIEHLKVSRELEKPVIIHTRDAKKETLELINKYGNPDIGGVLHCFTEDYEMAMQAIDMGYYISASGIITFKSAKKVQQTFAKLPLERLLVETDSPYLAPVPFRGKENQPAYTRQVAEQLAILKGVSYEDIAKVTTENFQKLFGKIE
ncbi:TatD DNase family protein [Celerinatantimonas diazotrophica]|uniref:TatD DNase family protein n=1 Tax=Celerinatantimonas diazotrophica TaxID=412034 RepID=A0A4R1JAH3_9GAMM|nr:TatD DNase family protein [Celerinatantimonas diazotrophica]CAG9296734.1 putative metal-dependent hydrolase YcfH [Celerinatantimonas diazotrophica]